MKKPRRICLWLNTPSELAIRKSIEEVEKIGSNEKLTKIVISLNNIREELADFIDGK